MTAARARPDALRVARRLPGSIMRAPPQDRAPRLVTSVYGSLEQAFSGSTWYLANAGMANGVLDGAFTLQGRAGSDPVLAAATLLWKMQRRVTKRRSGGFKFSATFQDVVWDRRAELFKDTLILNNYQLYSRRFLSRRRELGTIPCFYIDGTLTEYFYGYGEVEDQTIGRDMVERAISLEREGYAQAERIFVMSRNTARTLAQTYGVPSNRITLVIPGANLQDAAVPDAPARTGWVGPEFTLGFVGLFPIRKGLDKLAAAVSLLRARRLPVRLKVIGRCPEEIAAMDGVHFLGLIDKRTEGARFVEEIRGCDLGCQLSRAELLGIAMMEFLRVGVPVLATAVGGMPEVLNGGGGLLVPSGVTVEQLAAEIEALMQDTGRYRDLCDVASARSGWARWDRAAREIDAALTGVG